MISVGVKICGLTRRPDAELAAASGARYGGVILAPGYRRSVALADARRLFEDLPLKRVGVFVDADADSLRHAAETAGLDVLQLHGQEPPSVIEALRSVEGDFDIWKALRPRTAEEFLADLERYEELVDGILVDGWSATAAGGTGARFPWEVIAAHRERVREPLHLIAAGGLSPVNVAAAIGILRPSVVDVSSGVEDAPGIKNHAAVRAFIAAARGAAPEPMQRS